MKKQEFDIENFKEEMKLLEEKRIRLDERTKVSLARIHKLNKRAEKVIDKLKRLIRL